MRLFQVIDTFTLNQVYISGESYFEVKMHVDSKFNEFVGSLQKHIDGDDILLDYVFYLNDEKSIGLNLNITNTELARDFIHTNVNGKNANDIVVTDVTDSHFTLR